MIRTLSMDTAVISRLSKNALAAAFLLGAVVMAAACGGPAAAPDPQAAVESISTPVQEESQSGSELGVDRQPAVGETSDSGQSPVSRDEEAEPGADVVVTSPQAVQGTGERSGVEGALYLASSVSAPETPLHLKLYMSQPPVVGEEAEILVVLLLTQDHAPDVTALLELPPPVRLVSGQTQWVGPLSAGDSAEFSATVVFTEPGEYSISALALAPLSQDVVYGDDATVFLTIGEENSHFGFESNAGSKLEVGTVP